MRITPAMRQQARSLAASTALSWTQKPGVIVSVSAGVATVRLSGDPTDLPGMTVAAGVTVTAGTQVWVAVRGSDAYVMARRT